jgi:hypothetical protein
MHPLIDAIYRNIKFIHIMFENSLITTTRNTLPLDYEDHSVNAA